MRPLGSPVVASPAWQDALLAGLTARSLLWLTLGGFVAFVVTRAPVGAGEEAPLVTAGGPASTSPLPVTAIWQGGECFEPQGVPPRLLPGVRQDSSHGRRRTATYSPSPYSP